MIDKPHSSGNTIAYTIIVNTIVYEIARGSIVVEEFVNVLAKIQSLKEYSNR